ncbi:putative Ig domain-containing protein [Luteipulveratus sp. YIM 133132]|uniref:Ig domain-containing protein n=1 Tax=Luteipulveratus flavus TaxID=3031728 RepID=A0ABT6C6D5_9MICO|nr:MULTISPECIES: putative Ig domain-containing protein [unclassified Luteipulveratus]MDE9365223.1 putative Ig domain-containing protein [Luteipulveratus sp. YIM 133132]MDF8264440.1 putative Ig domain-containing protein [Luteipulveratus sp. YIM 133296]
MVAGARRRRESRWYIAILGTILALVAGSLVTTSLASAAPGSAVATASTPIGYGYAPLVSPQRTVDTRVGRGASRLVAGVSVAVPVGLDSWVPADAKAVVLNVTVLSAAQSGWLSLVPSGASSASGSAVNFPAGQAVPNQVIVRPGSAGAVDVTASTAADLLIDVVGYVEKDALVEPLDSARVLDTRPSAAVSAGETRQVPVAGKGGVPASGVAAVIVNLTAVSTSSGWLTAYPTGQTRPSSSTLNYAGATRAAMAVLKVGSDGSFSVYSSASTHLLVDVIGWVPQSSPAYVALNPSRLMDTRTGLGAPRARVPARGSVTLQVAGRGGVPTTGVAAVELTLAAVNPATSGYVSAAATNASGAPTSVLNFPASKTFANSLTATLDTQGRLSIYSSAQTDLLVDVVGYLPDVVRPLVLLDRPVTSGWLKSRYAGWSVPRTGGTDPEHFSVDAGVLPPGMSLTGSGVLIGTPLRQGTWTFTVLLTDGSGQRATRSYELTVQDFGAADWDVAAGDQHSCARARGGSVWCWGDNTQGQLGDGSTTSATAPVQPQGLSSGVVQVAAGGQQSCALLSTGEVSCWGQVPGPDTTTPATVDGLGAKAVHIAVGPSHACAALEDGAVSCWGAGDQGQTGTNGTGSSKPSRVTGLPSSANQVAVGAAHSCAVVMDGSVWCWGANDKGQLGDRTTTGSSTPRKMVGSVARATYVLAAGGDSTCVADASLVDCTGQNDSGQLADGTTADHLVGTRAKLGGTHLYPTLAVGTGHACAGGNSDALSCSGRNDLGQLGNGSTDASLVGVLTALPSTAVSVAVGATHTCAARPDEVWCWGDNAAGQLGTGTTAPSALPVRVVLPAA